MILVVDRHGNVLPAASLRVAGKLTLLGDNAWQVSQGAVQARFREVSSFLTASKIRSVTQEEATRIISATTRCCAEVSVKGTITNYVSVANFTVAARNIDASTATFEGGSAANLANGRKVEVEGRLKGAVLVAKKVSFQ